MLSMESSMTRALELPRLCILTQDQAESSALEDISSHLQSLAQSLHSRIRSKRSHTSILERLKIHCSANLDIAMWIKLKWVVHQSSRWFIILHNSTMLQESAFPDSEPLASPSIIVALMVIVDYIVKSSVGWAWSRRIFLVSRDIAEVLQEILRRQLLRSSIILLSPPILYSA